MIQTVLLIEDSKDDILFMRRAFGRCGVPHSLQVVEDGAEALAYLAGRDGYADRFQYPLPALVLFDLKIPLLAGFEVLRWVRTQPCFASTVMVVLTSSDHPADIRQAYLLGANSFLSKPGESAELTEMVRLIAHYWLQHNVTSSSLLSRQREGFLEEVAGPPG